MEWFSRLGGIVKCPVLICSGLHGPEAIVELFESAKEKADREEKEKLRLQEEERKREKKRIEREARQQKAIKAGLERFKRQRRRQSDSSSSGGDEDASSQGQEESLLQK